MKKLQLLSILLIGLATTTFAQTAAKTTATIKTPTVQCEKCKARIENYMSHEDGIVKINVDYKKDHNRHLYPRPYQHREHQGHDRQRRL